MQENQWPRNPVLTFWQSKQIGSDNAQRATFKVNRSAALAEWRQLAA
jgi:hypothetical protein